jgi:hypothetical protein
MTPPLLGKWVKATVIGWLLGILFTVGFAFIGEALGLAEIQTPLGLGMGAGVGLMQARLLPIRRLTYTLASAGGLVIPFLFFDLLKVFGADFPYTFYGAVGVGGITLGAAQSIFIRRLIRPATLWMAATAIGWSAAAGCVAFADMLPHELDVRGPLGALLYIASAMSGGVVVGLLTGLVLRHGRQIQEAL